jgi:hypothetical protein
MKLQFFIPLKLNEANIKKLAPSFISYNFKKFIWIWSGKERKQKFRVERNDELTKKIFKNNILKEGYSNFYGIVIKFSKRQNSF